MLTPEQLFESSILDVLRHHNVTGCWKEEGRIDLARRIASKITEDLLAQGRDVKIRKICELCFDSLTGCCSG